MSLTLGTSVNPWQAVALAAVFLFLAKSVAWGVQRRLGNAGIVDGIWAWALGGLAAWFAWVGTADATVRWVLAAMGGLWGLRLGTYLWWRNWKTPEDWRYAEMRADWGPRAQVKMFWFYQFQNLFTLALACSAFMPAAYREGAPGMPALLLSVLIWGVAVGGEALADAQLKAFKARPGSRCATKACGATPATPITSLNACTGWPTCRWPGAARCGSGPWRRRWSWPC